MAKPNRRNRRKGLWALLLGLLALLRREGRSLLRPLIYVPLTIAIYVVVIASPAPASPPNPPKPAPADSSVFPHDTVWDVDTIPAYDDEGHAITFLIGTLNDNFRWLLGSTKLVGINGRDSVPVTAALAKLRPDITQPLVVVGMASHENARENLPEENGRAQERTDVMAQFAEEHFIHHPTVYKVNLGADTVSRTSSAISAVERRVVVLQLTCVDKGADVRSGMRNALIEARRRGNTSIDGGRYSNFSPERFSITAAVGRSDNPAPPECHRRKSAN